MRNKYLHILIVFLFTGSIFAQTTETFETEIDDATSFTDNSLVFNITSQAGGTFDIANFPGTGWSGTAIDNKYIDNSGFADIGIPVQFTIKSAGGTPFLLKSIYLFLSQSDLNPGTGSCTITGKKAGSTVFTATSNTGFNNPTNFGVNNGFTFIDLTSYGGANNSNVIIDEYVVTTTGTFEYVALDAMNWEYDCSGLVAPTASAQNFCDAATVANLVATGNSLKWYADASGGSALVGTTALATGTYYVTSSSIGCESARIAVAVTITPSSDNVTTISACDSYFWNGTTYTTSGIKIGPTANCVTEKLDLTINTSPIATVSLITLLGNSTVLTADQTGASYQWIDCNNANTPISGEINQSFTPTVVGTYSVIVTLGTCSVTSDCIVVSTLKTDSFDVNAFNFYPNPIKDNLNLSYSKEITSMKVFNMIGQTLLEKSINSKTAQINMSGLSSGTYFVEVKSLDSYKTIKVIKN